MRLGDWLKTMPRGTLAWLARELGVESWTVRDIAVRQTPVGEEMAQRISDLTSGSVTAAELARGPMRMHRIRSGAGARRTVWMRIAFSRDEYEVLQDRAAKKGLTAADFLRRKGLFE